MSEMPEIGGRQPIAVDVEAGKSYWWCACGRSQKQPFCDGSHKVTSFTPVEFKAATAEEVWFCACKRSAQEADVRRHAQDGRERDARFHPPLWEGEGSARKATDADGWGAASGERTVRCAMQRRSDRRFDAQRARALRANAYRDRAAAVETPARYASTAARLSLPSAGADWTSTSSISPAWLHV